MTPPVLQSQSYMHPEKMVQLQDSPFTTSAALMDLQLPSEREKITLSPEKVILLLAYVCIDLIQ